MSGSIETRPVPGPRVLRWTEEIMLSAAVTCTILMCFLIVLGVFTRALFNWSLPDMEIVVRELMVITVILPLAYVTAERTHISVDVFVNLMPARWSGAFDVLAAVIGFLVLLPITYGAWTSFTKVWGNNAYYFGEFDILEWPGKLTFFLGYLVFSIRLLTLVISDTRALFRRSDNVLNDSQ